MSDLELLEDTFNKLGVKYHKITNSDYVYIQKMGPHDIESHIYIEHYGLFKITNPEQLGDYFEFYKGKIVSW